MALRQAMVGATGMAVFLSAGCGVTGLVAPAHAAKLAITPANNATGSRPEQPVVVKADGGRLTNVTVKGGDGRPVAGSYDKGKSQWTSSRALMPSTRYTVTAVAKNSDGKATRGASTFQTLTPKSTFGIADITPMPGETVGVGMPIIVKFDRAIYNKADVERALSVRSDRPAEGAWRWIGNDEVVYRTKRYWQPHQNVTFTANLAGVRGGKDMYAIKDYSRTLKIGYAQVSTVDSKAGRMTVRRDGHTLRTFGISVGNASTVEYTTTSGVHLAMEKAGTVTMTSPGRSEGDAGYYSVTVNDAVRISDTGEYYHADPLDASHGCVHIEPENAQWMFGITQRGDVVDITGTDRRLDWNNGWGFWQLPWDQWVKGSALH